VSARVLALAAPLLLVVAGAVLAGEPQRYEGAVAFAYPADATATAATDVVADVAIAVEWKDQIRASVLASAKKIEGSELEALADKWHGARIKNRAAWGMHTDGGPPRDSVRIGGRHWYRWRDRIGSVLGAQEQSMTCGPASGRLACVVVTAPVEARERADQLAAMILSSLSLKKPR
jgi:hypothetical protein